MKTLSYVFIILVFNIQNVFPQTSEISPEETDKNIDTIYQMIAETRRADDSLYKQFLFQTSNMTGVMRKDQGVFEQYIYPIAIGTLIGSVLILAASDLTPTEFLDPADDLILSKPHVLERYLGYSSTERLKYDPDTIKLDRLLNRAFGELEVIAPKGNETEASVRFAPKGAISNSSRKIGFSMFKDMLDDISKINPRQYPQYLDQFEKFGPIFISGDSPDLFELKNKTYYRKIASKLKWVKSMKGIGYGADGLGLMILIWEWNHLQGASNPAVEITPDLLNDMIMNDPPALKTYVLEPHPLATSYLADYCRKIEPAMLSFNNKVAKIPNISN